MYHIYYYVMNVMIKILKIQPTTWKNNDVGQSNEDAMIDRRSCSKFYIKGRNTTGIGIKEDAPAR